MTATPLHSTLDTVSTSPSRFSIILVDGGGEFYV